MRTQLNITIVLYNGASFGDIALQKKCKVANYILKIVREETGVWRRETKAEDAALQSFLHKECN